MQKKITMQDIADKLGISKSLVSKALSNKPGVSKEARDAIRETAVQLGYRMNSASTNVASSTTGNVTLILPRSDMYNTEFWGRIIGGCEDALRTHGFSLILSSMDRESSDETLPTCITDRKVDGVIIGGLVTETIIESIQLMDLPIALIESGDIHQKTDHVRTENFCGGYEATWHLLEHGHRHIGFVGALGDSLSFAERYRGMQTAINEWENGGTHITLSSITEEDNDNRQRFSPQQLVSILNKIDRPSALFCINDYTAIAVMQLLRQVNIACPQDLSLIGFDNIENSSLTTPPLTTIDTDKEQLGRRAVELLISRMNEPRRRAEHVLITTNLVQRETVRTVSFR